ncbi:MAG: hypothetical protein RSG77_21540 [Hafnia sp.]
MENKSNMMGIVLSKSHGFVGLLSFQNKASEDNDTCVLEYLHDVIKVPGGSHSTIFSELFENHPIEFKKSQVNSLLDGKPISLVVGGEVKTLTGHVMPVQIPEFTIGTGSKRSVTIVDACALMIVDVGQQTFSGGAVLNVPFEIFPQAKGFAPITLSTVTDVTQTMRDAARRLIDAADQFEAGFEKMKLMDNVKLSITPSDEQAGLGRITASGTQKQASADYVRTALELVIGKHLFELSRKHASEVLHKAAAQAKQVVSELERSRTITYEQLNRPMGPLSK